MVCVTTLVILVGSVLMLVSVIRWFEQVTEAVELAWWSKVFLLVAFPFAAWFYPSRVSAGRPTAVPRHVPVRGFGTAPAGLEPGRSSGSNSVKSAPATDRPPPGTPPEFLGLPKVPPGPVKKSSIDPDKIAKLKQKMRDQGMLGEEDS